MGCCATSRLPDKPPQRTHSLQAFLDFQLYFFFIIPSRFLHCPSSTCSASSQSQVFLFYSASHSFEVFLNFPFLCSIYWELALIYVKPGRADHQKSLFLYTLHSTAHHTHFRRHRTRDKSSNSYPHPQREASLSNFASLGFQKLYAFLTIFPKSSKAYFDLNRPLVRYKSTSFSLGQIYL